MAVVTATSKTAYGKLTRGEISGGLTVQTGVLDWGTVASAGLVATIPTVVKTVAFIAAHPKSSAPGLGAKPPYILTQAISSSPAAVLLRRLTATARYYNYILIGY